MHKRIKVECLITARVKILGAFTLAATVFIGAMAGGAQAQPANTNDTARLLAGMQPAPGSSLLAQTKEQASSTMLIGSMRSLPKSRAVNSPEFGPGRG